MHTHLKQPKRGHVFWVPNLDPCVQVFWLGKTAMILPRESFPIWLCFGHGPTERSLCLIHQPVFWRCCSDR